MKDEGKTRKQLIEELVNLRNQLAEVEKLKTGRKQARESTGKIQNVEGAAL